jgi:hypothetical protein
MQLPTRGVEIYYWFSVVFAVLDWTAGLNVRVSALDDPWWRAGYYAALVGCALLVRRWPGVAGPVALVESSINLLLIVLAVLLPYYATVDLLARGGTPVAWPLSPTVVTNLLVASTFWIVGYLDAAVRHRPR